MSLAGVPPAQFGIVASAAIGNVTFASVQAALAAATSAVDFNGQQVRTSATPVGSSDLTNKDYVDTGLSGKASSTHASTHQAGQSDALSGNLDAVAKVTVRKNTGADVGSRRRINFVEGSNVTLTVTDDAGNEEVDVEIAAGGGSGISELTGDVTAGPGTGSQAATIANDVVTFAKMQNLAADTLIGRITGTGDPEAVTCTAAGRALLDDVDDAAQRTTLGLGTAATQNTSAFEVPLTFSTGLTRATNTVSVNTTQNIAALSNLSTNGFVKTTLGTGALSVDTSTYLTGNQTVTLSGDVTGSGATAITATIPNDTVTYAQMQDVSATDRILGRSTAGAGDVEEITCTAAGRALLDDASASAQVTTLGLPSVTQLQARDIPMVIGDGVNTIAAQTIYLFVPYNFTVTGWQLIANASGSIVIDIQKTSYASFPASFTSVAGTEKPTLSSAQKNEDLTLSTWTDVTWTKGEIIAFVVEATPTTVARVTLRLIGTLDLS